MPFASSETIKSKFETCIKPYRKSRVEHAAYELSLGAEVVTTSDGVLRVLDPVPEGEHEGGHINIEPGQLAMLITEEVIAIPPGYLGFISIKASIKLSGLINISGFHVDPGFVGRLKFTVYNAGSDPVPLRRGQPTFLLWFAELDQVTEDSYDGKHKRQRHISSKDINDIQGELASPSSLDERVRDLSKHLETEVAKLQGELSTQRALIIKGGIGVIISIVGIALTAVFGLVLDGCNETARIAPSVIESSQPPAVNPAPPATGDTSVADAPS